MRSERRLKIESEKNTGAGKKNPTGEGKEMVAWWVAIDTVTRGE